MRSLFAFVALPVFLLSIPAAHAVEESVATSDWNEEEGTGSRFGLNLYSIFYGPGVRDLGSTYQTTANGEQSSVPLLFRNFVTASYALGEGLGVSATQYFLYVPVQGTQFAYRDPYLRIYSENLLTENSPVNWYADLRAHLPLSSNSRASDLIVGVQTYQTLAYPVPGTELTLGLTGSARLNIYGNQGGGNDLEFYAGPNLSYQALPNLAFTLIYDAGASHVLGEPSVSFVNDGNDLQPGVSWDVTPHINVSPFVNIYTGKNTSLRGSYLGMTMSVIML